MYLTGRGNLIEIVRCRKNAFHRPWRLFMLKRPDRTSVAYCLTSPLIGTHITCLLLAGLWFMLLAAYIRGDRHDAGRAGRPNTISIYQILSAYTSTTSIDKMVKLPCFVLLRYSFRTLLSPNYLTELSGLQPPPSMYTRITTPRYTKAKPSSSSA